MGNHIDNVEKSVSGIGKLILVAVSLLMLISLLTPVISTVRAASTIAVSPVSGIVGSSVTVSITGLTSGSTYSVDMVDSAGYSVGNVPIYSFIASSASQTFTFSVPPATGGYATISLHSGGGSALASTTFDVTTSLSISPSTGIVGSLVTIAGNGYSYRSPIYIQWDGVLYWNTFSNRSGSWIITVPVPYSSYGSHTIYATDTVYSASGTFFTEPYVEIVPANGIVGQPFGVMLTGFSPNSNTEIIWSPSVQNNILGSAATDINGTLNLTFSVPQSLAGSTAVEAIDSNGVSYTAYFTVDPHLSLSRSAGPEGTYVTVTGTGFGTQTVNVAWDNPVITLFSDKPNSVGTFSSSFATPPAVYGNHVIAASDGTNTSSATFFVSAYLKLDPYEGAPQTVVKVNISGFLAGDSVNIIWDPGTTSQATLYTGIATNSTGASDKKYYIVIPPTASGGAHLVEASDASGIIATAEFYVGPTLLISPSTGYVGSLAKVTGFAYPANTVINIYWGKTNRIRLATATTDSAGGFNATVTIPFGTYGNHLVSSNNTATAGTTAYTNYTILPSIHLSSATGNPGDIVNINASGFLPGQGIALFLNNAITFYNNITNLTGSAMIRFVIPLAVYGNSSVYAGNMSDGLYSNILPYFVTPDVSAVSSAYVGQPITVSGNGYDGDSLVSITWDGVPQNAWGISGNTGSVSIGFTIPASTAGLHYLNAYDSALHFATKIGINVLQPSVPILISPQNNSYTNLSKPTFAWQAVSYAAGYILQYSTTPAFSTSTNVSVTATSYTFTSPLSNGIWYWHVRAIDSGGNAGGFSATFRVVIDTVPPSSATGKLPRWEGSTQFNLNFTANDSLSGVSYVILYYSYNGSTFRQYETAHVLSTPFNGIFHFNASYGEGTYAFYTIAVDKAGNVQPVPASGNDTWTTVDLSVPASYVLPLPQYENSATFKIAYTATSSSSPVKGVYLYYSNASGVWEEYGTLYNASPITFTAPSNGRYSFFTVAVNMAGNVQPMPASGEAFTTVDTSRPATTISIYGTFGDLGWYISYVSFTLNSSSISGVSGIYYSVDGGQYSRYTTAVPITTNGWHNVSYYAVSNANISGTVETATIKIDTTSPVTSYTVISAHAPSSGWYNSSVTVLLQPYEHISGVSSTYYSLNNGNLTPGTTVHITSNGINTLKFYSVSVAGISENINTITIQIDTTLPVTSISFNGTLGNDSWYISPALMKLSAVSLFSPVSNIYYSVNGGSPVLYVSSVPFSLNGVYNISYWSVNVAGNAEAPQFYQLKIDTSTPVTQYQVNGTMLNNSSWYVGTSGTGLISVHVNFTSYDRFSGIASIYLKVDNGAWQVLAEPGFKAGMGSIALTTDGIHTLYYYSVSTAGIGGSVQELTVKMDNETPYTYATVSGNLTGSGWYNGETTITLHAMENYSGVAATYYTISLITSSKTNNATARQMTLYTSPIKLVADGVYIISYFSVSVAGLAEAVRHYTVYVESTPVTVASVTPISTIAAGGSINITATLFDLSGIKAVYISIDNGPWMIMHYNAVNGTGGTASYLWKTDTGDNGIHLVKIMTLDNAGNVNIYSFTVTIDNPSYTWITFTVILVIIIVIIVSMLYSLKKKLYGRPPARSSISGGDVTGTSTEHLNVEGGINEGSAQKDLTVPPKITVPSNPLDQTAGTYKSEGISMPDDSQKATTAIPAETKNAGAEVPPKDAYAESANTSSVNNRSESSQEENDKASRTKSAKRRG